MKIWRNDTYRTQGEGFDREILQLLLKLKTISFESILSLSSSLLHGDIYGRTALYCISDVQAYLSSLCPLKKALEEDRLRNIPLLRLCQSLISLCSNLYTFRSIFLPQPFIQCLDILTSALFLLHAVDEEECVGELNKLLGWTEEKSPPPPIALPIWQSNVIIGVLNAFFECRSMLSPHHITLLQVNCTVCNAM